VFGHNPDLTYLATYLSSSVFDNVPTSGIVCIDFDVNNWKDIQKNPGKLRFFEFPKKYRK
jgi:phosphohistidine phosphatase